MSIGLLAKCEARDKDKKKKKKKKKVFFPQQKWCFQHINENEKEKKKKQKIRDCFNAIC
jgi:hypothetical protein